MVCGIYKITCTINNRIYIGSSMNIQQRWTTHKRELNNNEHDNMFLQRDWNRYGEENFTFEILEECEFGTQYTVEQKYLNELKPFFKDGTGYNIKRDTGFGNIYVEEGK